VLLVLIAALLFPSVASAAAGDLDPSFDSDGKVTTDFGSPVDESYGVAIQPDGKIVVAGLKGGAKSDFALARYNRDGSLDTSFDSDGKVTTDFGSPVDQAIGVAIQPDGRIVAAGTSNQGATGNDFALARYDVDGTLDTSFDSDGKVTTDFGSPVDEVRGVAMRRRGEIVAVGWSNQGATGDDFALARYNVDGTLDTSFDSDGKVTTNFGSPVDQAFGVAIEPDRDIVAAGWSNGDFALARYDVDGSLDTSFDTDGKVTTDFGSALDVGSAGVAIQPNGRIVAAGYSNQGATGNDFAVARYLGR
jgi:uncharacterized delta-60 repeat protein